MGFLNNQLLSNVQWTDQSPETLVWRFQDVDQVLQNGSTVIVNPGQAMLFVNEGVPAGVIDQPGSYDLKTASVPFFSSMLAIFRGMDTKHKAKVFFFNINQIPNIKWGTKSPLKYSDPVYKFPVGLRAFGNYTFKITDANKFFTEFIGDRDQMTLEEFKDSVTDRIITPISDALATAKFAFTDIDSNREELSKTIGEKIAADFAAFGFTMQDFRIENTDFDEATQQRVGSIADMQAKAQAINAMGSVDQSSMAAYAQVQQLEAMNTAAANPNGIAGAGIGMGVGMGLGANMAGNMSQAVQQPQAAPTPTAPAVAPAPVVTETPATGTTVNTTPQA